MYGINYLTKLSVESTSELPKNVINKYYVLLFIEINRQVISYYL